MSSDITARIYQVQRFKLRQGYGYLYTQDYLEKVQTAGQEAIEKASEASQSATAAATSEAKAAASAQQAADTAAAFDDNAAVKTEAFNANAISKTNTFNSNASAKQSAFDTNAGNKTTDLNTNASNKTETFNANAAENQTAVANSASAAATSASSAANSASDAEYWAGQAASGQVQADWNVSDTSSKAFILNKPTNVSTFTNDAGYINKDANNLTNYMKTTDVNSELSLKAPLASPALTGTPTAPTATAGTNTTQIATTAFVSEAIDNIDALPSQTGNTGKFLTTDGTNASWAALNLATITYWE